MARCLRGRRQQTRPLQVAFALLVLAALACAQSNVSGQAFTGEGLTVVPPSATSVPVESPTEAVGSALPTAPSVASPPPTGTPDPTALPVIPGPSTQLIPDSELVYGPPSATFDIAGYVASQGGYLQSYHERVMGEDMDGAGIVRLVALDYSISPRLLLALLENQTGWVTRTDLDDEAKTYPLAKRDAGREGLWHQLTWAADTLNRGYYGWRQGQLSSITFAEQQVVFDPGLNAGTVALQFFFSHYYVSAATWLDQLGADGITGTYARMFGDPFAGAVEPLLPPDLIQLPLSLPWDPSETWYFLGGPHGAYESGSAWAALDFAPPGPPLGCAPSNAWLRAAAPGVIARSDHGVVVIDLDYIGNSAFDGYEQTGWALFYLHVDSRDRVAVGTQVNTGDIVGHPGCEGGTARGAHLHIARKFNGEWIPAAGALPFDLAGWTPTGGSVEYAGDLVGGGGYTLTACECRSDVNAIRGETP
jgi:LasA protease